VKNVVRVVWDFAVTGGVLVVDWEDIVLCFEDLELNDLLKVFGMGFRIFELVLGDLKLGFKVSVLACEIFETLVVAGVFLISVFDVLIVVASFDSIVMSCQYL